MAPILILPADIYDEQTMFVRVDLGKVHVDSDLRTYDKATKYKEMDLESELYDNYLFGIESLSVSI